MSSPRRPVRALSGADALVALAVALLYVGAAKFGLALAIDAPQVTAAPVLKKRAPAEPAGARCRIRNRR